MWQSPRIFKISNPLTKSERRIIINQKDKAEKNFIDHNDIFADIVNVLLFDGEEVVKEEDLRDADSRSQYLAKSEYHEQFRDVSKYWENVNVHIAWFGIENQTQPDKHMPIRVLSYDAGAYREQLLKGNEETPIYPVVSLVLLFNEKEQWNTSRSLLDSLELMPVKLRDMVNDYKINVFEIAFLPRETIDKFKSDFWLVADYYWQLAHNPGYISTTKKAKHVQALLQLMAALTNDKDNEKLYNMFIKNQDECGGEDTMAGFLGSAFEKGLSEGRQEGLNEGQGRFAESFIRASEDDGKTPAVIISDLQKYFKLSEAEAKGYYEKYSAMQPV